MKWFTCFCIALMSGVAAAFATPPPEGMTLAKVESSGIEEIVVEHYTAANPTGPSRKEVWLADRNNREKRVFLFRHVRLAEVLMAPDQGHLVINNAFSGNSSSLLMYERVGGLEYKQVNDGKALSTAISTALAQKLGYNVQDKLDNLYIRAEKWDGPRVLHVKVSGHGGKAQLDNAKVSVSVPAMEVAVLSTPSQQLSATGDGGMPPAAAPSIQPGKTKTSTTTTTTTKSTTPTTKTASAPAPAPAPKPSAPVVVSTTPQPPPHQQPTVVPAPAPRPEVVIFDPNRPPANGPGTYDGGTSSPAISIPPPSPTYQRSPQDDERRAANVPPPAPANSAEYYTERDPRTPSLRFSNGSTVITWVPGQGLRRTSNPYENERARTVPYTSAANRGADTFTPELDGRDGRPLMEMLTAYFRTNHLDVHHVRMGGDWAFVDVTPERRRSDGGDGPRTQMLMKLRPDGWVILRSTIANMRDDDDTAYSPYLVRVLSNYPEAPTGLFPRDPLRRAAGQARKRSNDSVDVDVNVNVDVDLDEVKRRRDPRPVDPNAFPQPANAPAPPIAPDPKSNGTTTTTTTTTTQTQPPAVTASAYGTYEPAKGSDERKAIVEGLRASLGDILGKKCVFQVSLLRVNRGYACIRFTPLDSTTEKPAGKPGTAVLRNTNGSWSVVVIENDLDGEIGDRLRSDVAVNYPDVARDLIQ